MKKIILLIIPLLLFAEEKNLSSVLIADGYKKLDELEKQMVNMRIQFAELASPGHPSKKLYRDWDSIDNK